MDRSAGRSPHWDATEVSVGRVVVAKTGQSIGQLPVMDRSAGRSPHSDATEASVDWVAVPKFR